MNIASFQSLVEQHGTQFRAWGASGSDVAKCISDRLNAPLPQEFRHFIEDFGNISISPFLIAVTGNKEGEMTALESTETLRRGGLDIPQGYLRIMEHAGESYFVDVASGIVTAFDSLNITPSAKTLEFGNFDQFLQWIVKESTEQLQDPRFEF